MKALKKVTESGLISAMSICGLLGIRGQKFNNLPLKEYQDSRFGDVVYFQIPHYKKNPEKNGE